MTSPNFPRVCSLAIQHAFFRTAGGIGSGVLSYFQAHLPTHSFAASSSNASSANQFISQGISFRHVDYNGPSSLEKAFAGVKHLLFVSSNTFDNELRTRQHRNVVDTAKKVGVGHVWYTSLAFGGYGDESTAAVQQAHIATERLLTESGVTFTSIREGIYTEAFPLFLGWYPSTAAVYLPSDGAIAYTSRAELAEATARLMIEGGFINEKVLLTASKAYTFSDFVDIINFQTGRNVRVEFVGEDEYVRQMAADEGGKPEGFFKAMLSWYEGLAKGDGETVSPLMERVLGRKPKDAKEVLTELFDKDRDYRWHQCYVKKSGDGVSRY